MVLVVAAVLGLASGWLLERTAAGALAVDGLRRPNHRGATVTTGVGVLIPVAMLLLAAGTTLAQSAEVEVSEGVERSLLFTAMVTGGYALLGLLDDVAGHGQSGGFRGHLRALGRGVVTTGMLKWLGGAAVAVSAIGMFVGGDLSRVITMAAVIALSANLGNLLDRRPGRTTKVALIVLVPVVAGAARFGVVAGPVAAVAVALALLPGELRERHMLGDAGANAVGAAVGLAIVATAGNRGEDVAALVLLALNLASEVVSFSAVIDRVPPLRAIDRLGRRR